MKDVVLKNRYRITAFIDGGGMSDIYLAYDKVSGADVCVKVLKEEFSRDKDAIARFTREARSLFSLKHPKIIKTLDTGTYERTKYIVMEYFEGETLKRRIAKGISREAALKIMVDICSAMEHAHSKGIIHRDLKPQNILINDKNEIRIIDFGIAKTINAATQTMEGDSLMGSVHYFSPEQARGMSVDERSDIYSLGIVFYELMTGQLPFDGNTTVSVALKHLNEEILAPKELVPDLPTSINNIILKCTMKDKRSRYSSIAEMRKDIISAIRNPLETKIKLRRRKKVSHGKIITTIVAGFVLVAVTAVAMYFLISGNGIECPTFVGLSENEALELGTRLGIKIEKNYEYNDDTQAGIIFNQMPERGTNLNKEQNVVITISSGEEPKIMPELSASSEEEALTLLEEAGITNVRVLYEVGDPVGYVKSQSPSSGSQVTKDEEVSVTINISGMAETAVMPEVQGAKIEEAIEMIKSGGFSGVYIYLEEDRGKDGVVTVQQPVANMEQPYDELPLLWVGTSQTQTNTLSTIKFTIKSRKASVKIVWEDTTESGFLIRYVLHEGEYTRGEVTLPIKLRSYGEGQKQIVAYANGEEVFRKTLNFTK